MPPDPQHPPYLTSTGCKQDDSNICWNYVETKSEEMLIVLYKMQLIMQVERKILEGDGQNISEEAITNHKVTLLDSVVEIKRDVVPIARMEAFRALKFSRLESFRALNAYSQIGGFQDPKMLRIEEFQGPTIMQIGEFQDPQTQRPDWSI